MDSNLVRFQKIISKSGLSKRDQDNLINLFSKATDKDLEFIIDLFKKYPQQIKIVNKLYRLKSQALRSKDKKAWDKILQQEYKILEEEIKK